MLLCMKKKQTSSAVRDNGSERGGKLYEDTTTQWTENAIKRKWKLTSRIWILFAASVEKLIDILILLYIVILILLNYKIIIIEMKLI